MYATYNRRWWLCSYVDIRRVEQKGFNCTVYIINFFNCNTFSLCLYEGETVVLLRHASLRSIMSVSIQQITMQCLQHFQSALTDIMFIEICISPQWWERNLYTFFPDAHLTLFIHFFLQLVKMFRKCWREIPWQKI